jgi:translation initiation factor IF-3
LLIDEDGTRVGVVPLREALALAEERGLDLVEVAPNAVPPVCRVLDYGKYRYEQTKKEREARKHQKQAEIKEVRLKPKTDDHDIEIKAKQARKFLLAGDKVKFTVRFRGREMAHPDIGREMLENVTLMESRTLSLLLAPGPKAKILSQAQNAKPAAATPATSARPKEESPLPSTNDISVDDEGQD